MDQKLYFSNSIMYTVVCVFLTINNFTDYFQISRNYVVIAQKPWDNVIYFSEHIIFVRRGGRVVTVSDLYMFYVSTSHA